MSLAADETMVTRRPVLQTLDIALICGVIVATRIFYALAGVAFDATPLPTYWQYLPIELLREELATSLLALHSQPPLFNLFLGVGLRTPLPVLFYQLSFTLATIVLATAMIRILRELGLGRAGALAAAAAFVAHPTYVLYEHWLFYSTFEAMLLTTAVAALTSWRRSDGGGAMLAFAGCSVALVGMRAIFHPVWGGGVLVLFGLLGRRLERRLTRAEVATLAAPLVIGLAMIAKNVWLIGEATTSTWTGMNLSRVTFWQVPAAEVDRLIASGRVSPLVRPGAFQPPHFYAPYEAGLPEVVVHPSLADHPAVARPTKNNGQLNFNYVGYVRVSRQLWRDSLAYIVEHPGHYAANVLESFRLFTRPASEYTLLEPNRTLLGAWVRPVQRILYPGDRGWLVWWSILTAVLGGSILAWSRAGSRSDGLRFAALFSAATVGWLVIVANAFEFGENNRFRVAIDPLLFCGICGSVQLAQRKSRRWWIAMRNRNENPGELRI